MGRLGVLLWETRLAVSKQLTVLDFTFDYKTIVGSSISAAADYPKILDADWSIQILS